MTNKEIKTKTQELLWDGKNNRAFSARLKLTGKFATENPELIKAVYNRTSYMKEDEKAARRVYDILNDIYEPTRCSCGNEVSWQGINSGYSTYCSGKCANDDPAIRSKIEQTMMDRYGVKSPVHSPEIRAKQNKTRINRTEEEKQATKDKIKATKLARYGDENYTGQEKRAKTNMERYGGITPMSSEKVRAKLKQVIKDKYGVENVMHNDEVKKKVAETNKKRYGGAAPMCSKTVQEKSKKTNLERYGKKYTFQVESIKKKIVETLLERYGVEHPMYDESTKQKVRETCIEKYGTDSPLQNEEVKRKIRTTLVDRYGVENPSQSKEILDKKRATSQKNYGCDHPMQNSEYMDKMFERTGKWKIYCFESGRTAKCQGYEPWMLDELVEEYSEEDILTETRDMPKISYRLPGEENPRRYYPDAYLPNEKIVCECKSVYTLLNDLEKNIKKFEAAKRAGYTVELFLYDARGKRLDNKEFGF